MKMYNIDIKNIYEWINLICTHITFSLFLSNYVNLLILENSCKDSNPKCNEFAKRGACWKLGPGWTKYMWINCECVCAKQRVNSRTRENRETNLQKLRIENFESRVNANKKMIHQQNLDKPSSAVSLFTVFVL